jgi:penicillin amidase
MNDRTQLGRTLTIAAGLVGVTGLLGVGALGALRRSLPRTRGRVAMSGLNAQATVYRDRWGVPHIYAANNEDVFCALGYVHAQDRLWQMELHRRTAQGGLAEIFGEVALSSDRFIRVLGFGRIARLEAELLDEETGALMAAYVRGVNHCIDTSRGRLPLEFTILGVQPRPWTIDDVVVFAKIMALNLSANWMGELLNARIVAAVGAERAAELQPRYLDDRALTVPSGIRYSPQIGEGAMRAFAEAAPFVDQDGVGASNAWAIGPARSASGHAMLANDQHLAITQPNIWYAAHLEGGDFSVAGGTIPGLIPLLTGHNARIAWGQTASAIDTQDLFIERFDAENPLRYRYRDEWLDAKVVREEIVVKGRSEPVIEEVRLTRNGPILDDVAAPQGSSLAAGRMRFGHDEVLQDPDPRYTNGLALRWPALTPSGSAFRAAIGLNKARDWDEFREALSHWDSPALNFAYADVDGHFGYALAGKVPIRRKGDGLLPVPAWQGDYDWDGFIPHAALPAAFDPPEGFVVTANNKIAGMAYRYHAVLHGSWLNSYRADRIGALLAARSDHDAESFAHIHMDVFSLPGRDLAALLADLTLNDPLQAQAREILLRWDGNLNPEQAAGAIYEALRYHLSHLVYIEIDTLLTEPAGLGAFGFLPGEFYLDRAFPGILRRAHESSDRAQPDAWLGRGRSWHAVLSEALATSVDELRKQLGDNPANWHYGRVHSFVLRHPLGGVPALTPIFNRGPWPVGGDSDTVNMGFTPRDSATGPVFKGASIRAIYEPGVWGESKAMLPGGQSGHPGSTHYSDMAKPWLTGQYHAMPWQRDEVIAAAVDKLVLEPM